MRVLNVNKFFFMNGGVERYFFALTKLLEDRGHDVIHFSMQDDRNFESKFSEYFVSNINVSKPGLSLLNKAVRPIWSYEARRKLEALLDEYKPDIAHIHMLYHQLSPSILPLLKERGIPVVMTVHDYKLICPNYLLFTEDDVCKRCKGHRYYNPILHKCLKDSRAVSAYAAVEMSIHKLLQVYEKHVDLFIAPSKFVRDVLVEFGQNPNQIVTIPHFVEPTFFERSAGIKAHQEKDPYILYFGRLATEKGVDKLLEMMYIYKPEIQLKLAGTGPEEAKLFDYVRDRSMRNIEFLGHLDAQTLTAYIKGAKAVVMPSRFYEPFGFAALETMALGTPLVASDAGALAELVPPQLGRLFKRDDRASMAEALQEVLTWNKKDLAQASKAYINASFLPEQHYNALMVVYRQLTNSNP